MHARESKHFLRAFCHHSLRKCFDNYNKLSTFDINHSIGHLIHHLIIHLIVKLSMSTFDINNRLTIWSIIRSFSWSLSCWGVNIQHQQSKRANQSTFLEHFVIVTSIDWYCNSRLIDHSFDPSFDHLFHINHSIDHSIHHWSFIWNFNIQHQQSKIFA